MIVHIGNKCLKAIGIVTNILPDDTKGSKHQKFIVKISHNKSVLVIHNINISTKIFDLKKGDKIEFSGEYQWNEHGGMVHWTHKDPNGVHLNGWIKHKGKLYQ